MFVWFEIACVAVIVATLVTFSRHRPPRELMVDYGALALGGFIGEETCISFYDFYRYADAWHLRVDHVPLLVPLIWPLVILSASDVARALSPRNGPIAHAGLVAVFVVFDATLVELLSVRAGFWRWAEPGYGGVPVIGILGWGFFAFGAELARTRLSALGRRAALVVVVAPLTAHLAILASWWTLFRDHVRGELGATAIYAHVGFALVLTLFALRARLAGLRMDSDVWGPRLAATAIFLAVFLFTSATSALHATALGVTAVPYLVALRWRRAPLTPEPRPPPRSATRP